MQACKFVFLLSIDAFLSTLILPMPVMLLQICSTQGVRKHMFVDAVLTCRTK